MYYSLEWPTSRLCSHVTQCMWSPSSACPTLILAFMMTSRCWRSLAHTYHPVLCCGLAQPGPSTVSPLVFTCGTSHPAEQSLEFLSQAHFQTWVLHVLMGTSNQPGMAHKCIFKYISRDPHLIQIDERMIGFSSHYPSEHYLYSLLLPIL